MSDTKEFDYTVGIDDVIKVDVEDGDALLVTLPETANKMSREQQALFADNVSQAFQTAFENKNLKVVVMPYGMTVELIKGSQLEDKV